MTGSEHPGDEDEAPIPQEIPVLIEETADLEPPVEVVQAGATTEYRVAGRVFAVASARVFEADLGAEVASAAVRTPDAGGSGRGPGWVRFSPAAIDDHGADRIVAWFELARRIAAGRQVPGGREARA